MSSNLHFSVLVASLLFIYDRLSLVYLPANATPFYQNVGKSNNLSDYFFLSLWSAETSKMGSPVGMKNPLLVTSHGIVRWLAPIILKSSCKLSVRYFPFDEQFCRLKFASWTYSKSTLLLQPEETEILQNYTGTSVEVRHRPGLFSFHSIQFMSF